MPGNHITFKEALDYNVYLTYDYIKRRGVMWVF